MPDLTELRRLAEAATPQPWTATYEAEDDWHAITGSGYDDGGQWMVCPEVSTSFGSDDADLIVAAVNALPELLAAAEALDRVKALYERVFDEKPLRLADRSEYAEGMDDGRDLLLSDLREAIDGEPQP